MNKFLHITILLLFYSTILFSKDKVEFIANFENASEISNLAVNFQKNDISYKYITSEQGVSSWYGGKFHNRKTANGEIYDMHEFTAAHRTLPFGSIIRVTDLKSNKSILVRINDRGPFVKKRIIDLSYAAAQQIDLDGITDVKIESFKPNNKEKLPKNAKDYFFAFSLDMPLLLIPKSPEIVIYRGYDYQEAMDIYIQFSRQFPDKAAMLLVPAKSFIINGEFEDDHYLIVRLPDNYKKLIKEFADLEP